MVLLKWALTLWLLADDSAYGDKDQGFFSVRQSKIKQDEPIKMNQIAGISIKYKYKTKTNTNTVTKLRLNTDLATRFSVIKIKVSSGPASKSLSRQMLIQIQKKHSNTN